MIIQHNLLAHNSNRMLGINTKSQAKSTEKLSSGYKINRAADDAAGLAISEKMRRQIRGLTQASENCQDGISLCQIADGALNEVHDILKRCEELTIKACNDTNSEQDRQYIQSELDALSEEIDRIHTTTVFNEMNIFSDMALAPGEAPLTPDSNGTISFMTGNGILVEVGMVDVDGNKIGSPAGTNAVGNVNPDSVANSEMAQFIVKAAASAVQKISANFPNLFAKSSTGNIKVGLELSNIDGSGKTLATASLSMSSSSDNTVMSYKLKVDTSDYNINDFTSYSDAKKADLAATIAHEMTHLVMYDTVTTGMLNGRTTSFPKWFVEGVAQTSSGDNNWMSNYLDAGSDASDIKNYKKELNSMPYGAGYAASMYLGWIAGGKGTVDSATIANGLDTVLTKVASGKTLDEVLTEYGFSGVAGFEAKFKDPDDAQSLQFMQNFITARQNGAGSLLGNLNETEANLFKNPSGSSSSYSVTPGNTWYANAYGTGFTWPELKGSGPSNGDGFTLQVGAEAGQFIHINQYNISASALLGGHRLDVTGEYSAPGNGSENAYTVNVTNSDDAARAATLDAIKLADRNVSEIRSYYGAVQNRLEHTVKNLDNVVENTTSAESAIRDTDMATEMVRYSNNNILAQAGTAMLTQANQSSSAVLSLLG